MQDKKRHVNLSGDQSVRKGACANFLMISSSGDDAILDFALIDRTEEKDGETIDSGVMTARVVVSRAMLANIRDVIDEHLEHANLPAAE
ncbi:MAG: hypothetical protein ACOX69_10090 [Coriobacteriales bacterium]|jgi:hypothetical protein